ncbi:UNVERIFIED_CONTAM: hypothetical protein GTU68_016099 [Idotea baltica]|nr:hypothetical protein [Idotea baltica]
MNYLEAVVLGFVQGITEFFPISSTGHLFLSQVFLGLEPNLVLELWLHVATLFAIVVLFWKDIVKLVLGFLSLLKFRVKGEPSEGVLALKLGTASVITAVLYLLFQSFFPEVYTVPLVAVTLLVTAFFILGAEEFRRKERKDFTWFMVVVLGLIQVLALMPGISRSGVTIACLVFLGSVRKEAARLSFLLGIPTILGALLFLVMSDDYTFEFTGPFLFSGLIAFGAALLGMKWMMKLVEGKWKWFSLYCFLLGGGLLVFTFLT